MSDWSVVEAKESPATRCADSAFQRFHLPSKQCRRDDHLQLSKQVEARPRCAAWIIDLARCAFHFEARARIADSAPDRLGQHKSRQRLLHRSEQCHGRAWPAAAVSSPAGGASVSREAG
ncbi:hypothetical protein MRX96_027382 [Rhipicephalus microplus]